MVEENEVQDNVGIEEKEYVQYCIDYTRTMTALEKQLHSCEDPAEIAMSALMAGADYCERK